MGTLIIQIGIDPCQPIHSFSEVRSIGRGHKVLQPICLHSKLRKHLIQPLPISGVESSLPRLARTQIPEARYEEQCLLRIVPTLWPSPPRRTTQ